MNIQELHCTHTSIAKQKTGSLQRRFGVFCGITSFLLWIGLAHGFAQQSTPVNACSFNNTFYVGASCNSFWNTSDIGAQINAAYNALPPGGGTIHIASGNYATSTAVVLNPGKGKVKPVFLSCEPGSWYRGVTTIAATSIKWNSGFTGAAITFADGTNGTGGMSDCTLIGPGNTTSSQGLVVGARTNASIQHVFDRNDISGFGTCLQFDSNTYINLFNYNTLHDCGIDGAKIVYVPSGLAEFGENITFNGGQISYARGAPSSPFPTNCVLINGGGDFKFRDVSMDQCGLMIDTANAIVDLVDPHMENINGPTTNAFVTIGPNCRGCVLNLYGGFLYEDFKSARTEMVNEASNVPDNAVVINVTGTQFQPAQHIPQIFNATGSARCCQRIYINGLSNYGGYSASLTGGEWLFENLSYNGTYQSAGAPCSAVNVALAGWGAGATKTNFAGFNQTCRFTINTGSSSFSPSPTVTYTLTGAFTKVPVCTMTVDSIKGGGGPILLSQTATSATAPAFTAQTSTGATFTPGGGESYTVVLRCGP